MKSGNKATKITWKRRHGPRSGKEKEQLLTSCLLLPNWRENPKSRFATETRTVCGTPCRAPSRVLRTVPQATSRLAGHESGHVPPQVGLARHRTFRWAGVHDLVKTNFAKKGSSVSSQPRQPKPRLREPRTHRLCTTAHASYFPLPLHIPPCGNWPFPTCRPHDSNHAMPQLTSSFASAAAGQNRDSRGSGRSDSARGAGSGEW